MGAVPPHEILDIVPFRVNGPELVVKVHDHVSDQHRVQPVAAFLFRKERRLGLEAADLFQEALVHDVRRRLEAGRETDVRDYILARRTQKVVRRRLEDLFGDYDVLALPSTPTTAPLITGKRAVVYVQLPGTPGTYQGYWSMYTDTNEYMGQTWVKVKTKGL